MAQGADSIVAITGEDFVIFAADATVASSILLQKADEDKYFALAHDQVLAVSGYAGDRTQFGNYIQKNANLYSLRVGTPMSLHATANFIRGEVADALRSRPYYVNLLLGGVDTEGPGLYFIDYLGSMAKLDFGTTGYAGYMSLGLLDRHYKKGLKFEEALKLIKACIHEIQTRLVLNSVNFIVKVVDKNGVRVVEGFTV